MSGEPAPSRDRRRPLDNAELARTMVQLADTLVDEFDVVELLTNLADRSVDLLSVAAAGIMLLGTEGDMRVVASSSDATQMLELLELQSNDGPCMDCYRIGLRVHCEDLAGGDVQWPEFSAAALRTGFRSVHAFPMRHRGTVIGALNLFCDVPGRLGDEEAAAAQAMSDVATIGVLHHHALSEAKLLNEQLQRALDSRVVIEQAKGITADRLGIGVDQAFVLLRKHSRDHNLRLANVARDVVRGSLSPQSLA